MVQSPRQRDCQRAAVKFVLISPSSQFTIATVCGDQQSCDTYTLHWVPSGYTHTCRNLCLKKPLPTLLRSHRRQTQNTRSTLLYTTYIFFPLGLVGQLQLQLKILTLASKGTQNCKKINCFYRRPHFWSGLLINYQSLDGV